MGKNHEFLSSKFKLFIFLIFTIHGLSHGSLIDQAGPLRALFRDKMRAHTGFDYEETEEWSTTMSDLDDDEEAKISDVGKMEDDLIDGGLPGQPSTVSFKQYGGYVTVDESKGRRLFYYFAEAASNPSSRPLILWLNGGPGCSSLGFGAMVELGPFGVKTDGKTLYLRRHAWNKVANMLFLESPAGVGFSYSNSTSDYWTTGDKRTAKDNYNFLINWFKRYPHYKARDFYITGESYSGFYIPELADYIISRNKQGPSSSSIQLKGIMIGNGVINDVTDQKGEYDYLWSHALISDETHRGLVEHCYKNYSSSKCYDYEARIETEIGSIDSYNIYAPKCSITSSDSSSSSLRKLKRVAGYDPCEGGYVHMYLNLPQVQEAFHANVTKLPYIWNFCSFDNRTWKDSPSSMFPIYKRLFSSGLRILLYSGDVDAVVPVSSTRYSIEALNLTVIKPWHPWSDDNKEVGGYKVVYDGLTFATVRGAGHEVPRFQPHRALVLLKMFIE